MFCADVVTANGVSTLAINSNTPCQVGQVVLLNAAEYDDYVFSPLKISPADGAAIGGAILMVWAVGFSIRWAVRALRVSESSSQDSD